MNTHDEDDGRTIADMNVPGMPWYRLRAHHRLRPEPYNKFTRKEKRAMILGALQATLPIALFFTLAWFLVMFLLDFLWLR